MSVHKQSVEKILENYSLDFAQCKISFLGNHGGYSGAALWQIQDLLTNRKYCLRRWPSQSSVASSNQLKTVQWIHSLFDWAIQNGFNETLLPVPIPNRAQQRTTWDQKQLFELTRWMPGDSDFWRARNLEKAKSAAEVLAHFHQATRRFGQDQIRASSGLPGIERRISFIEELNGGLLLQIESRLNACGRNSSNSVAVGLFEVGQQVIQLYRTLNKRFASGLRRVANQSLEQQICIKDIWHDHLFFENNRVSGIIDFGAIGFDSIATDISRLWGSLFGNSQTEWDIALDAYQLIRELSDAERELIVVYDRSTTMLAGLNWLKWILIENRKFESVLPIRKRMELMVSRMFDWI